VAFLEVFEQVDRDMDAAQRRFGRVEIDSVTVAIVNDVVETLKDIVKALEKAIRDNENNPTPPSPPGDPGQKPPLVSRLEQLKMIRAMQTRVNARTTLYGRHYDGEQVPRARDDREKARYDAIRNELGDLAGRQERLAKVTRDLSKERPMGNQ